MVSRLTLRQLEYFVAAAESGRIAEAAYRIHVSAPSISASIAHIEAELGVQLFVRHHAQGLSLTPVGRQVLREAKLVLEQVANLYSVASDAESQVRGPLTVGCFITLAPMVAPELCQSFVRDHPGVRVSLVEDHQEGLLERLRRAEIDIAVSYDLQVSVPDIHFEPLVSLAPEAIFGEGHPLAGCELVSLEDLAPHPMVLLDLPLSREYFLSLFHSAGLAPTIGSKSSSFEVVRTMVANGYGYSLSNVRPPSPYALDGRRLLRVPLAGRHRPMQLGLATAADRRASRVVEAFAQCCRASISDSQIPGMVCASPGPQVSDPRT